jgi:L-rhamnose isomerase
MEKPCANLKLSTSKHVHSAFILAQERYAGLSVNVNRALKVLSQIPISLHCWQGDDVSGFENIGGTLGGGLAVTGNYPGKARTPDEIRPRARSSPWTAVCTRPFFVELDEMTLRDINE